MGRSPSYDASLTRGPWSKDEDGILRRYIERNGAGNWKQLPKLADLKRCGKSCRLRWINYLQPDIKRGNFSEAEEKLIVDLHSNLGNRWSKIAAQMEGRTDNEIKNYWNTTIKKKLSMKGIDPATHQQKASFNALGNFPNLIVTASNLNNIASIPFTNNAFHHIPPNMQLLQTLSHSIINSSLIPNMEAMNQPQSLISLHNLNQSLFGLSVPSTNLVGLLGSLMNCGASNLNGFGMNSSGSGTSTANTSYYSSISSPTTIAMPSLQPTSPITLHGQNESSFGFPGQSTSTIAIMDATMSDFSSSSANAIAMPSFQTSTDTMPLQMISPENMLEIQPLDVNSGDFPSTTSNGQTLGLNDLDFSFNVEDMLRLLDTDTTGWEMLRK